MTDTENTRSVPTLGEYAAVIDWLSDRVTGTDQMPEELRPVYADALGRASLRRFASVLSDALGQQGVESDDAG